MLQGHANCTNLQAGAGLPGGCRVEVPGCRVGVPGCRVAGLPGERVLVTAVIPAGTRSVLVAQLARLGYSLGPRP